MVRRRTAPLRMSGNCRNTTVVFLIALRTPGTKNFILAHNHPGGSTTPSAGDRAITEQIKTGAKFLGLQLIDHYIITRDNYLPMADEGLL